MRHSLISVGVFSGMAVLLLVTSGCTSRGMTVTSEPPGAEVSINRRVVGETPIRVGFTHYGTYRLELRKYGYKVLVREEKVNPPIYGYDPVAVVADNVVPARLNDEVYLHYVLKPLDSIADAKGDEEKKADAENSEKGDKAGKGSETEKGAAAKPPKSDADLLAERSAREQNEKSALLERALAARTGQITHPRTHESIQVAVGAVAPAKAKKTADNDVPVLIADTYTVIGPALTPMLDLPPELGKVAPINQSVPQGPTLAREFGLEPAVAPAPARNPDEKSGEFAKPATEEKKPVPVVRTPKDEELIYDQAPPKDPEEQKKK